MTNKEVWNNWTNIHEESEQKKRQASASKTPCIAGGLFLSVTQKEQP